MRPRDDDYHKKNKTTASPSSGQSPIGQHLRAESATGERLLPTHEDREETEAVIRARRSRRQRHRRDHCSALIKVPLLCIRM